MNLTVEDILAEESLRCDTFIYKEQPFTYLRTIIRQYTNCYDQQTIDHFINLSLDVYNWYKRNGVHHDSQRLALMQTTRFILETAGYEHGS